MAGYIGSKAAVVSSGAERKKTYAITTTTTSLTGASYTPNQVHVFHNGVRLVDGTDYTATDGTTVTLTSAAENGDEVVVVSYATFSPSDAYTKAETESRYVNITGDTLTGALTGTDLTLSGGIYLGGTGSDNLLDDYEEGTWTPSLIGSTSGAFTVISEGNYTKVGRLVTVNGSVNATAVGGATGFTVISNIPFSIASTFIYTSLQASGSVSYWSGFGTAVNSVGIMAQSSSSGFTLYGLTSANSGGASNLIPSIVGTGDFRFSIAYHTDE